MRCFLSIIALLSFSLTTWAAALPDTVKKDKHTPGRPASIGIIGDTANVNTPVKAGLVMIGGGRDVDEAFKWMIDRSGGGDVVIIRASGKDGYNPYINGLSKVNSVETLKIDSKALANNDTVAYIIRRTQQPQVAQFLR